MQHRHISKERHFITPLSEIARRQFSVNRGIRVTRQRSSIRYITKAYYQRRAFQHEGISLSVKGISIRQIRERHLYKTYVTEKGRTYTVLVQCRCYLRKKIVSSPYTNNISRDMILHAEKESLSLPKKKDLQLEAANLLARHRINNENCTICRRRLCARERSAIGKR